MTVADTVKESFQIKEVVFNLPLADVAAPTARASAVHMKYIKFLRTWMVLIEERFKRRTTHSTSLSVVHNSFIHLARGKGNRSEKTN